MLREDIGCFFYCSALKSASPLRKSQNCSSQKTTKKEKRKITRTVPTLQLEQFKYFNFLVKNPLGGEQLAEQFSYSKKSKKNSKKNTLYKYREELAG